MKNEKLTRFGQLQKNPNLLVGLGVMLSLVYLVLFYLFAEINYMTYFFAFLIIGLFGTRNTETIRFWGPFLFFWMFYDAQYLFTQHLNREVIVREVYDAEIFLTGWFTQNRVLAFVFQDYRLANPESGVVIITDLVTSVFYMSHMVAPVILGVLVYRKKRDSIEIKRFIFTFVGMSFMALITFQIIPAAPPWYVWNEGRGLNFLVPVREGAIKDAGALKAVDELIGIPFFENAYSMLNANPYAPIPSLHNAYAIIITIYAIRIFGKEAKWILFYPFGMAFSSIWLNHHYILDILVSLGYITILVYLGNWLFKTKVEEIAEEEEPEELAIEIMHSLR